MSTGMVTLERMYYDIIIVRANTDAGGRGAYLCKWLTCIISVMLEEPLMGR